MGKVVSCEECRKAYRNLEALEDLRDNDGICLVCNAPIEVEDWDRVLASYEDDDFDDDADEIDDVAYIAMEYLEGGTLTDVLRKRIPEGDV